MGSAPSSSYSILTRSGLVVTMELNEQTSNDSDVGQQSTSGRASFSKLRSKLTSKGRKASGEDLKVRASVASASDNVPEKDSTTSSMPALHLRKHSREQSSQSQKQNSSSEESKPTQNSSQFQSQSHAENPPPLPPKSVIPPLENPLSSQTPAIIKFFFISTITLLGVNRFLHWSVGLFLAVTLSYVLYSQLKRASFDAEWEKEERRRLIEANDSTQTETAEWMNSVLKTVWPLITPQYFVPFIDLLEDSLMQLVPPIVHSCRVEDLNQGTVPLRIQSFIVLDSHEDAFTRGLTEVHRQTLQKDESNDLPLDVGDYINLEVTFAYRSPAARSKKKKSNKGATVTEDQQGVEENEKKATDSDLPVDQIHLLIYMAIGLQKIAAVEVPVWCEVLGIEGRMRLRLQMVPTAPFVSHVAFSLVGMPKLEISAKPLGKRMIIDAMHLPLISSYVLHSIEAVVQNFIGPKSYTVDVAGLLGAGDGPNNVYSLGAIILVIHQGIELPAGDTNGLCDPFVSVSFARAGKTLFTTRIIVKSRNAVWQELAVILVSADEVRDHERLRLTVFDADRFSADDPLGKVDISIDKLIQRALHQEVDPDQPTLMESKVSDLQPMRKGGDPVKGQLKYSVGFYRLSRPTEGSRSPEKQKALRQAADRKQGQSVKNTVEEIQESEKELPASPEEEEAEKKEEDHRNLIACTTPFDRLLHSIGVPLDQDELNRRKKRKERVNRLVSLMEGEQKATFGPPDKRHRSGILAFHIHSMDSLGFEGTQRSLSNSKRLAQKPQYTSDEDVMGEGTSKMPNSYVQVVLNDEAIFRTRTKTLNPRPFINAGSERWVADFDSARIDFVVRDARMRENDPILGIAALKLSDILVNTSRSSQWYTLTGGLGWGKIRITVLWRSVEVNLPKPLQGWNLGVVEVAKCFVSGIDKTSFERKSAHLMFETVGGRAETENVEPFDEYESGEGSKATLGFQWPLKEPVRIAVRQRYPNFLYIHLRSDSKVPGRAHKHAHTVVYLSRLIDGEETFRRVPLFETNDWQQFEQDILRGITTADEKAALHRDDNWQPILDQICNTSHIEYQSPPGGLNKDGHIRQIGHLDITLVFHPGVSVEHKSLIAGDQEMRIAYESCTTLMDAGERPRPKKVSANRRRKLSMSGGVSSSLAKESDVGNEQEESGYDEMRCSSEKRQTSERQSDTQGTQSEDEGQLTGDDLDSGEGEELTDGENGSRAKARALHSQHRGAAQIKGYRTMNWIKTNVEDGVGQIKRSAQQQRNKRIAKMESEGVSHF